MLKVDAVLDELEQVHLHQPGVVLPSVSQAPVLDFCNALGAVGWLWRGAVLDLVPMEDDYPSVKLVDCPRPRSVSGIWALLVRLTRHAPIPANPPPMERALDAIVVHLSIG